MIAKSVALLWVFFFVACASDPTQLVIVVDSDMSVPAELDAVTLEVTAPDGTLHDARAVLGAGEGLPRTLVLLHAGGALAPVVVVARGLKADGLVVERRARSSFVAGEIRVLRLELLRACVDRACPTGMTCAAEGCRGELVPPEELRPWSGLPPPLPDTDAAVFDAEMPDSGPCVASSEICNDVDDDCDGVVDEGFDLSSDAMNCGACGTRCPGGLHATGGCASGACELSCEPGFVDCNLNPADGCEADLSSPTSCGGCGVVCDLAFASEICSNSRCEVGSCGAGHADCDGVRGNGCETSTDTLASCGGCGASCPLDPAHAASVCVGGSCDLSCDPGFADCDADAATGCEADLSAASSCGSCGTVCVAPMASCLPDGASFRCGDGCPGALTDCAGSCADLSADPNHCGACATVCAAPANASASCASSACGFSCDVGFADCNGVAADGCETDLASLSDCGGCGVVCAPSRATASCVGGSCGVAACDSGYGDCDELAVNGCETALDTVAACGACGVVCAGATPDCVAGSCVAPVDVVVELALGGEHACARRASGGVECWGRNHKGQLGDGSTTNRRTPSPVPRLVATAIAAGKAHACALTMAGEVWCWGDNASGQLGDGSTTRRGVPEPVRLADASTLTGATAVAAGGDHSCAVTGAGTFCWGRNNKGQLGDGTANDHLYATPVSWPASAGAPLGVAAGKGSSCVVDVAGRAYCFGDNGSG